MKPYLIFVFVFLASCFGGGFEHKDGGYPDKNCDCHDAAIEIPDAMADAPGEDAPVASDAPEDIASEISVDATEDAVEAEASYTASINFAIDPGFVSHHENYQSDHAEMMRWIVTGDQLVQVMMQDGLTVRRGVGSADDFVSLQLRDRDYMPISSAVPLDTATESAKFQNLQVTFPVADDYMIRLFADVKAAAPGGQHAFDVLSADDVGCAGQVIVNGDFPLLGPLIALGDIYQEQLVYENMSNLAPVSISLGNEAGMVKIKLLSTMYLLELKYLNLFLVSRDGGMVRGSKGTFAWDGFAAYEGTVQISPTASMDPGTANGINTAYFSMKFNSFVLEPGVAREIEIRATSSSSQDVAGEFTGHSYSLAVKLPGLADDVVNLTFGDSLKPEEITPHDDMEGGVVGVEQPL